jgi:hypothetical protein
MVRVFTQDCKCAPGLRASARRNLLKALAWPPLLGYLQACAVAANRTEPVGLALSLRTIVNFRGGGQPSEAPPGFFVPTIPFGGRVIQNATELSVFYSHLHLSGTTLPSVDFSWQSVVCFTEFSKGGGWKIMRASAQQVIVGHGPDCFSVTADIGLRIVVAVVDGIVGKDATFAEDEVNSC